MSDVRPATVVGPLVADLTHLLAELIESALRYSPPDVGVEVRGYHDRRGYELLVIDRGPGMSRAELDAANRRLAGAESLTIAPSQYLGHYVTAALAARHDLLVELMPNGLGLTARVGLPTDLLVDAHPIPTRAQRRGGWAGPVGLGADGLDHAGAAAPAWSVRIR